MTWFGDVRHDLVRSLRGLAHAPGFAAAAIVTLSLGIGATSAIFSVVNALLLKPLTYAPYPERLVRLNALLPDPASPTAPPRRQTVVFTVDEARELATVTGVFEGVGIVAPTVVSIRGVENAGHVGAARLSASAVALLDARPHLGRSIVAADESGDGDVALLGFAAWQRLFAGDPGVVGRTITLQTVLGPRASRPATVIGVMPDWFAFPGADTDLWMPPDRSARQPLRGRLLARLAPGATLEAARDAIAPLVRTMREHGPEVRYELIGEGDELVRPVRPAVLVLGAAVLVLLLIACLNVANLLLARALSRTRELSVRAALGASRGRLVRLCLTESAVLGLLGGAGGLVVAIWGLAGFRRLATGLPRIDLGTTGVGWGSTRFPRIDEVGLDASVVAVTAATAVTVGLAVGVAAALRASRTDVFSAARASGPAGRSRGAAAARRLLVVLQVAGAATLLVGAVLLTRSLQHLLDTDPGYTAAGVLTFQVVLPTAAYPDARLQTFAEAMVERVRAVPGVVAAGYANQLPMVALRDTAGGLWTTPDAARRGKPDGEDARFVSRDYLETMGMRVVAGRGFTPGDGAGQPRVLLVNQALARRQFAGRDPIGQVVYVGRDLAPWTIVGVVSDVRQFGLDRAPEPQFFSDLRQWSGGMPLFPTGAYFAVKTAGRPETLVPQLRAIVRALDGDGALFNVARMDDIVASTVTRPRLYAVLIGTFAALGALLSAIGVYGVLAFLVQERTAEFGLRMALGASRGAVLGIVLRQGGGLVAAGLLIGLAGAAGLARALAAMLYGVRPLDPAAFGAAAVLLAAVAAVAILLPARQATRIDPLTAIRCE